MAHEFVSAKTRQHLREYFVRTTLGAITDAFEAARIQCHRDYVPPVGGQRRTLVEQYFHSLDFTRSDDTRKLLTVFENVLDDLEASINSDDKARRDQAHRDKEDFLRLLRRDGFSWSNGRLSLPAETATVSSLHDAIAAVDAPELNRQIGRLRDSVNDDPALAIGTAKEMLETTCKTILDGRGIEVGDNWDVPQLLKETRKCLKLLPDDIADSAKGADTIKRLLNNLGQIGIGLSELRNLYGSGHGRSGKKRGVSPRHARLAVGAVTTLILFLFETHNERDTA